MESRIRQNYCPDCERAINRLINQEYYTSYVYLAMSFFFERDDVALKHFARFFHGMSEAERRAAEELIDYQKRRGGRMYLQSVEKPAQSEWQNGLEALQCALQLQKSLNQSLQELHHLAADRNDPQFFSERRHRCRDGPTDLRGLNSTRVNCANELCACEGWCRFESTFSPRGTRRAEKEKVGGKIEGEVLFFLLPSP
uniref:Ferritin n=1 Tax=Callorhinchus milii TaxID=7868 RepID=A0A4W3GAD9_CALMI